MPRKTKAEREREELIENVDNRVKILMTAAAETKWDLDEWMLCHNQVQKYLDMIKVEFDLPWSTKFSSYQIGDLCNHEKAAELIVRTWLTPETAAAAE